MAGVDAEQGNWGGRRHCECVGFTGDKGPLSSSVSTRGRRAGSGF
jgi:hypothetical protein